MLLLMMLLIDITRESRHTPRYANSQEYDIAASLHAPLCHAEESRYRRSVRVTPCFHAMRMLVYAPPAAIILRQRAHAACLCRERDVTLMPPCASCYDVTG